jgi:predicted nucleic acid-binding protein
LEGRRGREIVRIVLDSGILASGMTNLAIPTSRTGEVCRRWLADRFAVTVSDYQLEEVERVLRERPYFRARMGADERRFTMDRIRLLADVIPVAAVVPGVAPHRHDDPVLATVAASEADWFVTGDAALLAMGSYAGVPFVDPARFLKELDAGAGAG